MSTAAHTPGPWTACFATFERKITGFHISGRPYGSTLPVCETRFNCSAPELEPNARLIAAAPEMLAALKIALLHAPSIRLAPERRFTIQTLEAAIAKAEGRS